ncbi:MAG: formate dehydrogenase [Verrucomicrobia bacterium]|nr:formate dehydrogenase [Verrucomicrobiota bacterium]
MSKNVSSLSGRKGMQDNLFERIVAAGPPQASAHMQIARDYLLGEAVTVGAASFYDLLSEEHAGKKALICNGSACLCAGTQAAVQTKLEKHLKPGEIGHITCLGRCHENSAFHYGGRNYSGRDLDNLDDIFRNPETPAGDDYVVDSLCNPPLLTEPTPKVETFYSLLRDALNQQPESLLNTVKTSKLRGRGGAGFPTGLKWEAARKAPGEKKYIICNADEGDPGAYIDRYLMEEQPHRLLFGMLLAGYVVGADEGVVYIRAEYPQSIAAVKEAIAELEAAGFCGKRICGSGFSFQFRVVAGAGAYICGEETALIASLEGRRPEVSIRPPFPTTEGLFGKPTVVNNVETFANIHTILSLGAAAYAQLGTDGSTGPKLVCLNGIFNRPGLYEVPMGTPLATVVDTLGGGFRKPTKALHIGGPLGGLVPVAKIPDLTVDFESFKHAGFLLGHGSILAVPDDVPIISYMEHLFEFCAVESCGKCFPCRLGATRGQEMLHRAIHQGSKLNRELLDDLLETMEKGSLCAHGGGIPLPIKNALQYFEDELREHFA